MILRRVESLEQKAKAKPKFELRGEIAQDHVAQMEDADYFDEVSYDEYWKN